MMRSLWSAASGMIAQQTNLDNIANNLANVNTTAYKKDSIEFKSLLYQTLQTKSTNNAAEQKPVPAQVGLGTRTASITTIFTQGGLQETSNSQYVALEGTGFFKVRDLDGTTSYTRDGSFNLMTIKDENGDEAGAMLCTNDGHPVLDQNNNTIVVPNGYRTGEYIVDKEGNLFMVDLEGNHVPMIPEGQEEQQKIGLVQFNNPSGLDSAGNNLYKATAISGDPLEESTTEGLARTLIHQGYLEMSNVQVADEMVNMIVAQRAYEMNSKAIQATDEMLQQANNLRR